MKKINNKIFETIKETVEETDPEGNYKKYKVTFCKISLSLFLLILLGAIGLGMFLGRTFNETHEDRKFEKWMFKLKGAT